MKCIRGFRKRSPHNDLCRLQIFVIEAMAHHLRRSIVPLGEGVDDTELRLLLDQSSSLYTQFIHINEFLIDAYCVSNLSPLKHYLRSLLVVSSCNSTRVRVHVRHAEGGDSDSGTVCVDDTVELRLVCQLILVELASILRI